MILSMMKWRKSEKNGIDFTCLLSQYHLGIIPLSLIVFFKCFSRHTFNKLPFLRRCFRPTDGTYDTSTTAGLCILFVAMTTDRYTTLHQNSYYFFPLSELGLG